MTYSKYLICLGIFMISISSCDDKKDETSVCYSFDVRQCNTDQYADILLNEVSTSSKENKIKLWLEQNGSQVVRVRLVENYHKNVCEACHVCPAGDRFFVSFAPENIADGETLELLNFQQSSENECE